MLNRDDLHQPSLRNEVRRLRRLTEASYKGVNEALIQIEAEYRKVPMHSRHVNHPLLLVSNKLFKVSKRLEKEVNRG